MTKQPYSQRVASGVRTFDDISCQYESIEQIDPHALAGPLRDRRFSLRRGLAYGRNHSGRAHGAAQGSGNGRICESCPKFLPPPLKLTSRPIRRK